MDMVLGQNILDDLSVHKQSNTRQDLFRVDIAYCMLIRDFHFQECCIRFGWADGSPQGLYDFLIWKYKFIKAVDLLRASDAVSDLSLTRGGSLGEAIDFYDVGQTHLGVAVDRAAANKVCAPVTQGQGATSAADKISAAAHMHSVESFDTRQMVQGLEEYQSFT